MTRVLIVDDEPQILRALRINLQARAYDVVTAVDGTGALREVGAQRPDLIVLDLGLPDLDGVEVIRKLRSWSSVPIVVLSGRADSRDKIDALDAGADDYVTKPFSVDELLARVRAVTRRLSDPAPALSVQLGRYTVDLERHVVRFTDESTESPESAESRAGGEPAAEAPHLTRTEWQLLEILLRNPGKLVSQRQLLQEVWGPTYLHETHYLRQYLTHLRRKLEDDPSRPRHLLTELGMGYRFQP